MSLANDGGGVVACHGGGDEERHVDWFEAQLDVIERCLTLWSNSGETMLTPFMGVGSEVYEAVRLGRRGIGVELKPSYYRQAVKNIAHAQIVNQGGLFEALTEKDTDSEDSE